MLTFAPGKPTYSVATEELPRLRPPALDRSFALDRAIENVELLAGILPHQRWDGIIRAIEENPMMHTRSQSVPRGSWVVNFPLTADLLKDLVLIFQDKNTTPEARPVQELARELHNTLQQQAVVLDKFLKTVQTQMQMNSTQVAPGLYKIGSSIPSAATVVGDRPAGWTWSDEYKVWRDSAVEKCRLFTSAARTLHQEISAL